MRIVYCILFFSFLSLGSIYSQSAEPQLSQHKFYLGIKYIYSVPKDTDNQLRDSLRIFRYRWVIGPDFKYEKTSGLEIICGYKFRNFLHLELSGSYIPKYEGSIRVTDIQYDYHQQDYVYKLYNISLSTILITDLGSSIEGYFKFGIGFLLRDRNVYGSLRGNMLIYTNYHNYNDQYSSVSTKLGFGVKWFFLERVPFVIEYDAMKAYGKLSEVKNWNLCFGLEYYF